MISDQMRLYQKFGRFQEMGISSIISELRSMRKRGEREWEK